jgi:hypothetical protein
MSLAHDLRLDWTNRSEWTNPLVTIGLSEAILNLGLSDDDLHEYITKDVARRLVMRFHPDRAAADVLVMQYQQRFSAAYAALQDRGQFAAALAAFRQHRAEDRADTRVHLDAIAELRRRLGASSDRVKMLEQELRETAAALRLERSHFKAAEGWQQRANDYHAEADGVRQERNRYRDEVANFYAYFTRLVAAGPVDAVRWMLLAKLNHMMPHDVIQRRVMPRALRRRPRKPPQPPGYRLRAHVGREIDALRARYEIPNDSIEVIQAQYAALRGRFNAAFTPEHVFVNDQRIEESARLELLIGSMVPDSAWPARTTPLSLAKTLALTVPALIPDRLLVTVRGHHARDKQPLILRRSVHRLIIAVG